MQAVAAPRARSEEPELELVLEREKENERDGERRPDERAPSVGWRHDPGRHPDGQPDEQRMVEAAQGHQDGQ